MKIMVQGEEIIHYITLTYKHDDKLLTVISGCVSDYSSYMHTIPNHMS